MQQGFIGFRHAGQAVWGMQTGLKHCGRCEACVVVLGLSCFLVKQPEIPTGTTHNMDDTNTPLLALCCVCGVYCVVVGQYAPTPKALTAINTMGLTHATPTHPHTCCVDYDLCVHLKPPACDEVAALSTNHLPAGVLHIHALVVVQCTGWQVSVDTRGQQHAYLTETK